MRWVAGDISLHPSPFSGGVCSGLGKGGDIKGPSIWLSA